MGVHFFVPWSTTFDALPHDYSQVIDCGGGTVDISAFVVVRRTPASLSEVGNAVGGPWGSTNVDNHFEGYLRDFVVSVAQDAGDQSLESFFSSSSMYRILQVGRDACPDADTPLT